METPCDDNIWKIEESLTSSPQDNHSTILEMEETSKDISHNTTESFIKQSDEYALSKTDQVSPVDISNIPLETSEYIEMCPIEINWKSVKFNPKIRYFNYPKDNSDDEERLDVMDKRYEKYSTNPIKALHYIKYEKGVAWLKACQKVKCLISSNLNLRESLTLSKLDMILENVYMTEVKPTIIKEEQEDKLKNIEETIENLSKENELLQMEVWYLGAKKRTLDSKRLEKSKIEAVNRTFNAKDTIFMTFADQEDLEWDTIGFHNLSAIPIDKDWLNNKTIDEEDIIEGIDEIKEEDEEDEGSEMEVLAASKPLKIESLAGESTFYKSNVLMFLISI